MMVAVRVARPPAWIARLIGWWSWDVVSLQVVIGACKPGSLPSEAIWPDSVPVRRGKLLAYNSDKEKQHETLTHLVTRRRHVVLSLARMNHRGRRIT